MAIEILIKGGILMPGNRHWTDQEDQLLVNSWNLLGGHMTILAVSVIMCGHKDLKGRKDGAILQRYEELRLRNRVKF